MKKTLFLTLVLAAATAQGADYNLRNGDAFSENPVVATNIALQKQEPTTSDLVIASGSAYGNFTDVKGLYFADGTGLKINNSSSVSINHLYIGDGIVFTDGTDTTTGQINWGGGDRVFTIKDDSTAFVDINMDAGSHIDVSAMSGGDIYLNKSGKIDTAGKLLQETGGVKVHATYSENGGSGIYKAQLNEGSTTTTLVSCTRRTLLAGNYANWGGNAGSMVTLTGYAEGTVVLATSSGIVVDYGAMVTGESYSTRNGQAFATTVIKKDSDQLYAPGAPDDCIMLIRNGESSAWTNNTITNIKGLYLADGAGIKFNHSEDVTVTYLYIGDGIGFDTDSQHHNVSGGINWSSDNKKLIISNAADAWVDIDFDAGSHIDLSSMTTGHVYLNESGKINSALGNGNTVHATLGKGSLGEDAEGYTMLSYNRTLLSGNYTGWSGNTVFTGEGSDICEVTGDSTGLHVGYNVDYTGVSNSETTGGVINQSGVSLNGRKGMVFANNTSTAEDSGAVITSAGDVSVLANEEVSFTGNTGTAAGAIYTTGEGATVTLAAKTADVTFSGNKAGETANDITFAGSGTLELSATKGHKLTLADGVNGGGQTVAINVNKNGEAGEVVLGGVSDVIHHTTVGGGSLVLKDGAVLGRATASVPQPPPSGGLRASGNGESGTSTFTANNATVTTESNGSSTIYADTADINTSTLDGITLNVAESATLTATGLHNAAVLGSGSASLVLNNVTVTLTDVASTAPVFSGFGTVTGTVVLDMDLATLRAAAAAAGDDRTFTINLFDSAALAAAAQSGVTLKFSTQLTDMLQNSEAAFGGNLDALMQPDSQSQQSWQINGADGGAFNIVFSATAPVVPEPSTATLTLLALAGLCARRRRK